MTVHSAQLGTNNAVGTAAVALYTCPANHRTIVKSILTNNLNAAANRVVYRLINGGATKAVWGVQHAAVNSAGEESYQTIWSVMVAGDVLQVNCTVGTVSVWVSGTELILP